MTAFVWMMETVGRSVAKACGLLEKKVFVGKRVWALMKRQPQSSDTQAAEELEMKEM